MTRRKFGGGTLGLFGAAAFGNASGETRNLALEIPAEEAPHDGCMMQLPVNPKIYGGGKLLREMQDVIVMIANQIAEFEPVFLLAAGEHHSAIKPKISQGVTLWDIPTDDLWARDSGPLFAFENGEPVVSGFNFNAWGNKQPHQEDAQIARRVAERLELPYRPAPLIGEAGGIEWDGENRLLAHESSWINPNRNNKSKAEITKMLLDFYGADELIWAAGIIGEDITDYHIDSLARFLGGDNVLIQMYRDACDEDDWTRAACETLAAIEAAGLDAHVIDPPSKRRSRSRDFVDSYVNYYIANGAIIGAEFGAPEDEAAAELLESFYHGREYVALNIDPLSEMGGGIHCATQQIPRGVL